MALLGLASVFACGPGSSSKSVEVFGITTCSLGCNGQSFSSSQHFENQDIKFTFNDTVDPASVDSSSISIIEINSGVQPTGTFIVNGRDVVFRPSLSQTVEGLSYGFDVESTYRIDVNARNSVSVVRSLKGRLNQSLIAGEITIEAATDLNPGNPSLIAITPSSSDLPTTRDFLVVLVFDDIMQTLPLANPDTGESLFVTVSSYDPTTDIRYDIPGSFVAVVDRDDLITTLTFTPAASYPSSNGGSRYLEVAVDQQVTDISNNNITNPGPRVISLVDAADEALSLTEPFVDASKQDTSGSVYGLWQTNSFLDSGQAQNGTHNGGGSGALGLFAPESSEVLAFNTDGLSLAYSFLLEQTVTVNDGFYPYSEVLLPADNNVTATGSKPLRLVAQGDFTSESKIILSGDNAPSHFGKAYFKGVSSGEGDGDETLQVVLESALGGLESGSESNAFGGDGALGLLSGGNGGQGGDTWFAGSIGFGGSNYFITALASWEQFITTGAIPGARYNSGVNGDQYAGSNGQGVGATAALGSPIGVAADSIADDLNNGSGMGSWCWPPLSNSIPNGGVIKTHTDKGFILHRSRGGGGGGYWENGARGAFFVANSLNGLGQNMSTSDLVPVIDQLQNLHEYNGKNGGVDFYSWDAFATVPDQVPDASGGQFVIPASFESLNPELGFLRGGSGGGGAGMGQHGSIEDRVPGFAPGSVGTWRASAGGGGGAGGGAIQVFAGSNLSIIGSIECVGGDGATSTFVQSIPYLDSKAIEYGPPGDAGGGGGSGGAILLEAGRTLQIADESIVVEGGSGGLGAVGNHGGAGGSGVVRFNTATGSETISDLQSWVSPDIAVESNPILSNGVPNVGIIGGVNYPGTVGDVNLATLETINGNASGVRSRWYEPISANPNGPDKLEIELVSYSIECEYSDGVSGVQTLTFGDSNPTSPDENAGNQPLWIAFQGAWMQPGESDNAQPELVIQTPWFVPGLTVASSGVAEFNSYYNRSLRFMLVFDQDVIATLMNGGVGSYFRVTEVKFDVIAR
ncbi:MAG: hypothetical protein ACI84O_000108 [Myxococcota bacterium]|jgi:hypothetical protein